MARLTDYQRRQIREENLRRRLDGRPQMTDPQAASFVGVTYDASTWTDVHGGWDSYTGSSPSSSNSGPANSSPSDSGGFSCGGGGGCD